MVDDKNQKTGEFKTLASAEPLKCGRNTYFISLQKISQDNGTSSDHLVLKKQQMNEDGSPRGQSRQLFIPRDDADRILNYAMLFFSKQKK